MHAYMLTHSRVGVRTEAKLVDQVEAGNAGTHLKKSSLVIP